MICEVDANNKSEYTEYVNKSGNAFQRIEWFEANNQTEYKSIMLKRGKDIYIAGTYIFIEYKNKKTLFFPRGPVFEGELKYDEFQSFCKYLKQKAVQAKCDAIIFDCKYRIMTKQNIEEYIINYGFKKNSYSKFWHYNWGIDINNQTIEEYLMNLKQKTRYNINYAIKKGLKVVIDNSKDSIEKFYQLLCITAKRDGFAPKAYTQYSGLFDKFKGETNLFWVYKDDILLSAAIHMKIGNEAYYMYGASSNVNREYKSTYLLHYEMIKYSIINNCNIYNMGGVGILRDENIQYHNGLYDFKKKFGGFLQDSSYTYLLEI